MGSIFNNRNLQTKFDIFREAIRPTQNEIDKVIASHTHLRQNILHNLDYVKGTILTGSYKRRTIIRPMNDVDVFVLLNYYPGAYGNPSPNSILNWLKQDLSYRYPNTLIKKDKPCIVIDFNHCKFELTPAIEGSTFGSNFYEIPNSSNTNYWQRVDNPDILGEKLSYANKKNPLLIPLIKMMKRCKQINDLKTPRSFEMEILAINNLEYTYNYREGVIKLLDIYGWLNRNDLIYLQSMTDESFGEYCRNKLFGVDFPKY